MSRRKIYAVKHLYEEGNPLMGEFYTREVIEQYFWRAKDAEAYITEEFKSLLKKEISRLDAETYKLSVSTDKKYCGYIVTFENHEFTRRSLSVVTVKPLG